MDRHAEKPSSIDQPWRLVLYSDGIVPGNVLALMPSRKSDCIYYSFAELGHAALAREEAWFTAATIRMSEVDSVRGKLPAVFKAL